MTIEIPNKTNNRTDSITAYFNNTNLISVHLVSFRARNLGVGKWSNNTNGWKYIVL